MRRVAEAVRLPIGAAVAVAAVTAVAVAVRLPELNPPSLWVDDLIWVRLFFVEGFFAYS